MNIDDLKQSLAVMADDVHDLETTDRLAGIDHKVKTKRRTVVTGAAFVAAVMITAIVVTPNVTGNGDTNPPATDQTASNPDKTGVTKTSLGTVNDHETLFYTEPAGATLIGHVVANAGDRTVSLVVTPSTLDLAWTDVCWDPGGNNKGRASSNTSVNGHPLGASSCSGAPDGPLVAQGNFGDSPAVNEASWRSLGVKVGQPTTITMRLDTRHGSGDQPQLGFAVYERGEQRQEQGLWFEGQVVRNGHTYQAMSWTISDLSGLPRTTINLDLPESVYPLYVVAGAEHLNGRLVLSENDDTSVVFRAGLTDAGGRTGDMVSSSEHFVTAVGRSDNGATTGRIYLIAYVRID
ncbi:MAG: hypothetical protein ABJA81_05105 [Nocardioidaceae bacterium]